MPVECQGEGSIILAFSTSLIAGALGDNGQNYKNILMAMNNVKWQTPFTQGSGDGSCPAPSAMVVRADVKGSNGIVHIIDQVLIPPTAPAPAPPPAHVCKSTEYCCPDAKRCLTPTKTACEPSNSNAECKDGDVCCPLAKICVTPG